jgi:putative Mg2+ transporter-C (MgtC) family protein
MDYQIQIIFQLFLAAILGGIIGIEREKKGKSAGFQTYSLVTLGACVFAISALNLFDLYSGKIGIDFDPSRIILAVATGIGFIGAGVIFYRDSRIEGITTAAGLWCASGIGVAVGCGLYSIAIASTILVIIIFIIFGKIEKKYLPRDEYSI